MGCDIHMFAEKKQDGLYQEVTAVPAYDDRNYALFGWLAGVRNYSAVTPLSEPRGLPENASLDVRESLNKWSCDAHSTSWFTVDELLAIDYSRHVEDCRVTRQIAPNLITGAATCEPGEGKREPLSDFIGSGFIDYIKQLKEHGAERIIFWFDN